MLRRCALSVLTLLVALTVRAGAFTSGNVVVLRAGDGSAALTASSTAVFLEEYAPAGGPAAQTLPLPTAVAGANKQLTIGGSTTSEGQISLSADGQYLVLGGYALNPGTASPTAAANLRALGRIRFDGTIDTSTTIATTLGAGNLRSVTSDDGSRFWVSTSSVGVHYAAYGATSSTQVLGTPSNMRVTSVFGNALYGSSGSGTFVNVFSISGGLATSGPQTATSFPGMPTTAGPSPYPFVLLDRDAAVAGFDSLYVADDRSAASGGGIQKWSFNGSTWTLLGTVAADTTGMRGLTGIVSGGNVVLYATTTQTSANKLVTYTDSGAFNAGFTGSFTTLATAPANTVYRSVAFAPSAPATPPPTVSSIVRAVGSTSPTNASSVDFTVTFTQPVTGVDAADFTLATSGVLGATVGTISGSGATYTVPVNTGAGAGTIRLDLVDNDSIVNASAVPLGGSGAGNGSFFTGEVFTIDRVPPAVQSIARVNPDPTNDATVTFTVTFTEPVTGNGMFGLATTGTLAGTSVTNVTGTGNTRTVTVNTGTGDGTLRLDFIDDDTVTDGVGNTTAANFTTGETYTIDRTPPAVQSIVRADADPTAAASVDFTITFDQTVDGLDAADFNLTTTGGLAGTSVIGISGIGPVLTITVNTGTGSGTLRLDFVNNGSVTDFAGNPIASGFTAGEAYTIDRSAPVVSLIKRTNGAATNGTSADFTVLFSQNVTGVDTTDFAIDATGTLTGAAVTNVAGSGSVFTVTASWTSGEGTISIDLIDDDSILNSAPEPLGGSGAGNGNFTTGETYTVDTTSPTVQSITRAFPNPNSSSSVQFIVTFSETVTGVDLSDFTLTTTGAITGASIQSAGGLGNQHIVSVNTGSGDGTIGLDFVSNGSVVDAAGNSTTAGFTGGETYTIDKLPPLVQSITRANANPNGGASVDFTVAFTEAVTSVDAADFVLATTGVSGASVSGVSGTAGTYTVTVATGTGDGTIRLDLIDNESIRDLASNPLGGPGATNGDFTTGESYSIAHPPAPVTGLAATPASNSVSLTWNASASATGYNVKRSTVSGGPYTTIAPNVATNGYTDNTPVNGTQYFYVVSALNANGESADSAQVSATPAVPANQIGVVISQIFPGNGGAYNTDYVELFNPTNATVTLTGYSLQYGSATGQFGSVSSNIYTFPSPTTIGAGRYLTVKFGPASASGSAVTADINVASGGLNMSGSSGKVALVINGTALGCGATATPCALPNAKIVDLVAYGTANNAEGDVSVKNGTALTTSEGALRKLGGCQDTNHNNNDFDAATVAGGLVPRTAATPQNVCPTPNLAPTINAISDPYTTVGENAASFTVNLTGADDNGQYTWAATPGTGIDSVTVSGGQGTANVAYSVTLQTNFYGTATFTAALSDGVNLSATKTVNIAVTRDLGINHVPTITPPANPYAIVAINPLPQTVNLTGGDDNGVYNWSATPGTGVVSAVVSAGQNTASVSYTVTIQAGFTGTATFVASLSDGVNPPANQTVNIGVSPTGSTVSHVVISQFYGSGGNANAMYAYDYIELYNPTGSPISLDGMSLQYGSATGTGSFSGITYLGGIIGPAEYFLVQLASNDTSVGSPLPVSPNLTGDINMSGTNGKIALVGNTDFLSGSCASLLTDPDIIDFVGYGSANCSEGGVPAPALGAAIADYRDDNGDTDTNHNGNDFTAGTPNPRRTSPIQEIRPFFANTEPGSGDNNIPRDASIEIRFTEPVDVTGAWYDLTCAMTGPHNSATIRSAFGNTTWVITPNVNFQAGEQCTVTLFASQISDSDTDDGPDTNNPPANRTWTFTVSTGTAPAYPSSVHLTFGNPSDAVADTSVPDNYLMEKPEYTLSYNLSRGTPNWVSWHLADEWVGTLTRVDTFRADPAIPPDWFRVIGSDYSGSGFDRGHMVPNADRDKETSSPINQATFLMTNMLPQAPDNNQGPWANLEGYLRTLLPANEVYIVAGGAGTGGTGSNGFATTITGGHVTVPAQTWKVALILPKASGDDVARVTASTCTMAVLMPNTQGIRSNPNDPNDWMQYLTTVDAIEALTGFDFFEAVPDAIEAAIEGGTNCSNRPGAASMAVTVAEDGSTGITLDGISPTNAPLTYVIVSNPANGSLSGSGANRTYTPAPDFNGNDSFTYKVNDGQDSNVATVTITVTEVNDAPVANADAKVTTADTPLVFPSADLVVNDSRGPSNENTQSLLVTAVTPTASTHGTVTRAEGLITYTPANGYSGPASFEYTVCDDGRTAGVAASLCATGIVNVMVNAGPPAPTATHFAIAAPSSVDTGSAFTITVSALDASNAVVAGYAGTAHFTSTSAGVLPADYTFNGADSGVHTFNVTLTTPGTQTITVSDGAISGAVTITVVCGGTAPAPAMITTSGAVCAGSTSSATATPGATSYQWTVANGAILSGQGTATITYRAGTRGRVTLSVTPSYASGCPLATTGTQQVILRDLPSAKLPAVIHACPTSPFTVTATLTGVAPFTVTWSDGFRQTNVRTPTVSRTFDAIPIAPIYIKSVSDNFCTSAAKSNTPAIATDSAPVIESQPANTNVPYGGTAELSVGSPSAVTYQWYQGQVGDTATPVGEDSPEFTTPALTETTHYWVRVSNACGSIDSRQVTVAVTGGKHRAVGR